MNEVTRAIAIPDGLEFPSLAVTLESDGSISFNWSVIERICEYNNLPIELFSESPEDNVCSLLVSWYREHIKMGGETNPALESMIADIEAEDNAGQPFSYKPGTA